MNNYNQPPVPPSIELKEIVKNTLNLTEAGLINVFNQFDNHCFKTLNNEAAYVDGVAVFVDGGWNFDSNQIKDLKDFINEVR